MIPKNGATSRQGSLSILDRLDQELRRLAQEHGRLWFWVQIPLTEPEYSEARTLVGRILSYRDTGKIARCWPYALARVLVEGVFRSFCASEGYFWPPLEAEFGARLDPSGAGDAFRICCDAAEATLLRPFISSGSNRHVRSILPHAGIPRSAVAPLALVLQEACQVGVTAEEDTLHRYLQDHLKAGHLRGLSDITREILRLPEGDHLLRQFVRAFLVLRSTNGALSVPPSGLELHPAILDELTRVLLGATPVQLKSPACPDPELYWDLDRREIGWRWHEWGVGAAPKAAFHYRGRPLTITPRRLSNGAIFYPLDEPDWLLADLTAAGAGHRAQWARLPDWLLFRDDGRLIATDCDPKRIELAAGEYRLLRSRDDPPFLGPVLEGFDLLRSWARRYDGVLVDLSSGWHHGTLRVVDRHEPPSVLLGARLPLWAWCEEFSGRRLPVFGGGALPEMVLGTAVYRTARHPTLIAQSRPLSLALRASWLPHPAGLRLQLRCDTVPAGPVVIHLALHDPEAGSAPLLESAFLWLPNARVRAAVGPLPPEMNRTLRLDLPGEVCPEGSDLEAETDEVRTQIRGVFAPGEQQPQGFLMRWRRPTPLALWLEWEAPPNAEADLRTDHGTPEQAKAVRPALENGDETWRSATLALRGWPLLQPRLGFLEARGEFTEARRDTWLDQRGELRRRLYEDWLAWIRERYQQDGWLRLAVVYPGMPPLEVARVGEPPAAHRANAEPACLLEPTLVQHLHFLLALSLRATPEGAAAIRRARSALALVASADSEVARSEWLARLSCRLARVPASVYAGRAQHLLAPAAQGKARLDE